MAAAGAFSAYGDAFAIYAELVRIFVEPAQRGVIIFERSREMSFRREAIVDRNDQASAILCHCLQNRIELSGDARDISAAMHVQKCRTPFRPGAGSTITRRKSGAPNGPGMCRSKGCGAGGGSGGSGGHLRATARVSLVKLCVGKGNFLMVSSNSGSTMA